MADPLLIPTRLPERISVHAGPVLLMIAVFAATSPAFAQSPEASSYPVDPVAAAGMTSGLPNGVTYRQAEMMQVRTSAQGAQGEAAAAMMARSAEETIEERNRNAALETARTNKAIKEEMRNRLKFERAAAQQQKVTANDMSTWQQNGGVRVERNVPDAFLTSLIEEEEQAAARAAESGGKKRFSLFNGDDSSDGGGPLGFLGGIRPPRLPFTGGDDGGESAPAMAAAPSDNSEPVFAPTGSPSSRGSGPAPTPAAPAPAGEAKPGRVPMISGAQLVDGRSPVTSNPGAASADRPPSSSETVSFADATPEPQKKPGLFSKFGSGSGEEDSLVPSSDSGGGGGFFGFGKKKAAEPAGTIDASLFPEGAVSQAPRGGRLTGGATVADVAEETAAAPTSTGSIALPGQVEEKPRGFNLPKPSLPSIPSITKSGGGSGGSVSSGYHVVTSTAQFMVYGSEQMQSEIRALPAGTSVMVTKPGETWSGIRLDDGTEGVVQNKNLKAGAGGGGGSGGEFATSQGR
jgi:hypothetical protein